MTMRIAVVFGGRSPEHDVSVKTGLQALKALDQNRHEGFPLYIGLDGTWWIGDLLLNDSSYIPDALARAKLTEVRLERRRDGRGGVLVPVVAPKGLFAGRPEPILFDAALLTLHGLNGEDGRLQGMLDLFEVPYTGMRTLSSALLMDKAATKRVLATSGIPMLPYVVINRPERGLTLPEAELEPLLAELGEVTYPLFVKPTHLGSSIAARPVANLTELRAALPDIFRLDTQAILEPCVPNLVEYNLAVSRLGGSIITSAIERPKGAAAGKELSYKDKYGAGGTKNKLGAPSQGMLSLSREINPVLPDGLEANIREWAATCFALTGGAGAPRIDFLSNRETGETWLNEVNPCPGSLGYFLWEAAAEPLYFPDLLGLLIEEALIMQADLELPADPTLPDARLFKQRG